MGLLPLEFTDCLQDSPYFRDSLHSHEKELERTSNAIKDLIKEVKSLLHAAKGQHYSWSTHTFRQSANFYHTSIQPTHKELATNSHALYNKGILSHLSRYDDLSRP